MPFRAVLFDLDGTLLDTLADIAGAANAALVREGLPTHPTDDYRHFIGDGVAMLMGRALPPDQADPDRVARCVDGFREHYGRPGVALTRPYDGIPDLLDALTARGLALAVLSNKPDDFTRLCVEEHLGRWPFRVAFGERPGVPRKPDPAGALEIARRLDLAPSEILYVGDSPVDMETARRAGMTPIGVAWGFRPAIELHQAGAEAVVGYPDQILATLIARKRGDDGLED